MNVFFTCCDIYHLHKFTEDTLFSWVKSWKSNIINLGISRNSQNILGNSWNSRLKQQFNDFVNFPSLRNYCNRRQHWRHGALFLSNVDGIKQAMNPTETVCFSRVNFLCWLLSPYPFHPCVTAVARKKSQSFCQKCRWPVTAKHAFTVRVWLCMKWHGAWLCGVHRILPEGNSFTWHQTCQCCKYTTSVDIPKRAIKS